MNPGPWEGHSKTAAHCAEAIARRCEGMDPEKYFICLLTFYQAGLLINDTKDSLFGARICSLEEKADLSATPIMRSLSGGPAS